MTAKYLSNGARALLNRCATFAQALLPQQCVLCMARANTMAVCSPCYESLPWLPALRCPQCATPTHDGSVCGACLSHPPHYDSVTAAFSYQWPLVPLLQQYKYGGNLALAPLFARALAIKLHDVADVIVPMPLSPLRLRSRGFNQALEIARGLGHAIHTRVSVDACRRVREGVPQASLPWAQRARNIRAAFVCDADVRGLRVAIVDDVMTSGATLDELARSLRRAGAAHVQGWVVARTLKHESRPRVT